MTLFFIGIGLGDKKDITVKGLEAIKTCSKVFLEGYTSIFDSSVEELSEFYGKKVQLVSREDVEQKSDTILLPAKKEHVAFLVIGDVFGATTHVDLWLRAQELKISCGYIPNASILNAIGITGLELYKFGKTTSMVFFEKDWKPAAAYETIEQNQRNGLHTLVLLDIKVAEPTKEDLKKGKLKTQPPKFMTIKECIEQLEELESTYKKKIISKDTRMVGCARIGTENIIHYGTSTELKKYNFGKPLHCLIVPGKLHFMEEEMLKSLSKK